MTQKASSKDRVSRDSKVEPSEKAIVIKKSNIFSSQEVYSDKNKLKIKSLNSKFAMYEENSNTKKSDHENPLSHSSREKSVHSNLIIQKESSLNEIGS